MPIDNVNGPPATVAAGFGGCTGALASGAFVADADWQNNASALLASA
jgi:hypothetical protein